MKILTDHIYYQVLVKTSQTGRLRMHAWASQLIFQLYEYSAWKKNVVHTFWYDLQQVSLLPGEGKVNMNIDVLDNAEEHSTPKSYKYYNYRHIFIIPV